MSATAAKLNGFLAWTYSGVDNSLPGNGGIECRDFLGLSQRCWESAVASLVALAALVVAYPRIKIPAVRACGSEPPGKRLLLLLMCLTFGIEIGFKLATRQMIWIGNPCHLATMMQLFLLAAPPSRYVTAAFRLHMHMLTGAPIAILFPVINTRFLPGETEVYFIQHILMLVIPFYLMSIGDPYIPEDLMDFNWAMLSFGFLFLYHFLPLQLLAYLSHVNLNNMLCPAVSDPFHGQYYRLFAIGHQIILIPLQGKLLVVLAKAFGLMNSNDQNSCNNAEFNENSCNRQPSISDSTKCSDLYEDSGFLGTGCALDSERDALSQSDSNLQDDEQCQEKNSPLKMNAVKRLVNGRIVDDNREETDDGSYQSLSRNGPDVSPDHHRSRNGHTKCH